MIRPEAAKAFFRLASALAEVDGRVPCRARDDLFHDDRKVRADVASICADCPVLEACGNYAEAADEKFGVWAGRDRTRPANAKRGAA